MEPMITVIFEAVNTPSNASLQIHVSVLNEGLDRADAIFQAASVLQSWGVSPSNVTVLDVQSVPLVLSSSFGEPSNDTVFVQPVPSEPDLQTVIWESFGDVPINDDGKIEESFLHFPIGTYREVVWRWMEDSFPNFSIATAMGFI